MCGIAGFFSFTNNNIPIKDIMTEFSTAMIHRGRDSQNYFFSDDNKNALAHCRLSIIDLSAQGNQPIYNEDRSALVVANGEIYNFIELRKELEEKGHVFCTNSDTEIILHAWETWGDNCISHFNGMFAFAIYNLKSKSLFLARDRLGIKPLFYVQSENFFCFASEFKALIMLKKYNLIQYKLDLNELELQLYANHSLNNSQTMIKDIKKLEAANYLYLQNKKIKIKKYWDFNHISINNTISFQEAAAETEKLLLDSIKLRLRSDVPVGILLSGGLDSSLIAAMTAQISNKPVYTFTAGLTNKNDERKYGAIVADKIKSNHTEIILDPNDIYASADEIIPYFDDCSTYDSGIFGIYNILKKLKTYNIKVVLFGDGADELFGGYSWFGLSKRPFNFLPSFIRDYLYYYAVNRNFTSSASYKTFKKIRYDLKSSGIRDIFNRISYYEICNQLPNNFLMKVDRGTMAHTLEGRVPYLDHRLVEFAFSLPHSYKVKGKNFSFKKANEKYVLKAVAEKYLPAEIFNRKKQGFSVPANEIIFSNKINLEKLLMENNNIISPFFSNKEISKLMNFKVRAYSPFEVEKSNLLYKLFIIQSWINKYRLST